MMKLATRAAGLCLAALTLFGMTGCSVSFWGGKTDYFSSEVELQKGRINATPTEAYYNTKDTTTAYEDEKIEEGGMTVVVGIANGLSVAKQITSVNVSLQDKNDSYIVEACDFDLDEAKIIKAGETALVKCIFTKEQVLRHSDLSELLSNITVSYIGCVRDGAAPADTAGEVTVAVAEANFSDTESYGFEGKIVLKNNYDTTVTPEKISMTLVTDKNYQLNKTPVVIENTVTLAPGETLTLTFVIPPADMAGDITQNLNFDTLTPKCSITLK